MSKGRICWGTTVELGVASAVISFNEGVSGILDVSHGLNITPRSFTSNYCYQKDKSCFNEMNKRSSDLIKHRRKQLRAQRKGFTDKAEQNEGIMCGEGLF